jgi:phosphoribosylglycinamide formyltransferase-1
MPQGLTVHFINEYVDRGRIILQETLPVFEDDKIYHIHQRLVSRQPKILREALEILESGGITYSAKKGTLFTQMTDQEETDLITKCSNLF